MPLVKRHIVKSISYRIVGTITTIILTLISGLEVKWVLFVGFGELVVKPILYFLHERFWYKYIKYGLKTENKDPL